MVQLLQQEAGTTHSKSGLKGVKDWTLELKDVAQNQLFIRKENCHKHKFGWQASQLRASIC